MDLVLAPPPSLRSGSDWPEAGMSGHDLSSITSLCVGREVERWHAALSRMTEFFPLPKLIVFHSSSFLPPTHSMSYFPHPHSELFCLLYEWGGWWVVCLGLCFKFFR